MGAMIPGMYISRELLGLHVYLGIIRIGRDSRGRKDICIACGCEFSEKLMKIC
jgi:hypothetical protein